MIKRILFALVAMFGALIVYFRPELDSEKDKFRLFLASHPFNQTERMSSSELKKLPKQDRPDLAWQQDYLRTLDPSLGRPAQERLEAIHDYVTTYNSSVAPAVPGSQSAPWVERGPSNVGGRTRALLWDPNDATGKKVWAGGVTGGLWYNNDITNSSSSWVSVGNFWDNIAITCIAADPNNSSVFYVGTGEGWGIGSSRGGGIWKSTDAGLTWNRITSTTSFYFINDLVVRNESGTSVVYAAVSGGYYNGVWHGASNSGLQRSINGGSAWSQTLPTIPGTSINYVAADIEISANNRLWVGTTKSPFGATDRGGGRILYSDNGTTWTTSYAAAGIVNGYGRVELATAPSNANYVYGIIENSSVVHGIVRTINSGSSWASLNEPVDDDLGIPVTDFSRGQAWYDLILAVDPSNPNKVIAGAINAHLSTNGGQSWSQISKWSNNSNMGSKPYSFIHADHHQILYKPGSANELIFGTDGGVFWTNSFSSATTSSVFAARNNEYNVTQFYAGAIHPTAGSNHMLAGSQDNGTQKFTTAGVNATTTVTGGDGAFCFIDQTDANIQISSYVYNSFYRSTNGGNNFSSIQNDQSTGSFINPADYDDVFNVLYSGRTSSTLNRIRNVETTPSIDFINIAGMSSMATHVRTSPYASGSSTTFVGTGAGDLFKVTNANGVSPSSTSLGSSLPAGSISCVELGANENELLVTYSNYGLTSIWYSTNGGATWVSKEGNLPDMPVRWALFNPLNRAEVLLATEVGVWSTQNFNSTSPTWTPSNSGLSHVRVDMLQIRDSDKMVMAITHGRGVFTSDGFNTSGPIADFGASSTSPCIGQSVQFTDLTQGNPTGWSWSFSPNTISFTNGTSSSSQNPQVSFSQAGTYQVALVSTNSFGTDSEVKSGYIVVGSSVIPSVSIATNSSTLCSGAPAVFTASPVNGGTAPTYQWKVNGINVGTNAATYTSSTLANGDLVSVELTSNALCAASNTAVSNSIAVSVTQSVTPTVAITASTNTICAGSSVVFTANAVNGGSAPLYQWKINGSNVLGSSSVFSTSTLSSNDLVTVELASSLTCVTSSTALSNGIAVTVNPQVVPSVTISASANSVCAGAPIVFTASPVNGGTAPSYQWKVNGVNVGTNSAVYGSSTLNNNDVVMVDMTSTAGCVSSASVLSSPLVVAITQPAAPGVGIQASSTSICAGEQVQFTALPANGGTNPIYTWKVNGVNTGVSSNMFSTSSLNNNDLVSAEMASSLTCITAALVSSNVVPMTVNAIPSAQITNQVVNVLCSEDTLYLNGVPTGGVFSSTSSGLIGQVFIPLLASNGSHWIKYTITGAGGCVGIDSLEVEVENIPVPTVSVSGDSVLTCNEPGYLYQWYSQSGLITGATGQSHTVTSNGSYHVEISTQHCSSSSDSVLVNTIGTESAPGLSIDAYPNPASNWLVITAISGSSKSISMVLYNSVGQMVWVKDWSISQGLNEKMIDVSSFATGIYQLRVTDESKEVVRRIEVL